jgi:hypothetical protein
MHKVAIIILASCILAIVNCSLNEKQDMSDKSKEMPKDSDSTFSPKTSLKDSKEEIKGECVVEYKVDTTYSKYARIEGRVIDITTEEALPLANIEIIGAKDGAVTDFKGKYHLTIPHGVYCVRARLIGYEILAAESILIETGKITIINFMLNPKKYGPDSRIKTLRSPP